jgi:hypothetical protein
MAHPTPTPDAKPAGGPRTCEDLRTASQPLLPRKGGLGGRLGHSRPSPTASNLAHGSSPSSPSQGAGPTPYPRPRLGPDLGQRRTPRPPLLSLPLPEDRASPGAQGSRGNSRCSPTLPPHFPSQLLPPNTPNPKVLLRQLPGLLSQPDLALPLLASLQRSKTRDWAASSTGIPGCSRPACGTLTAERRGL